MTTILWTITKIEKASDMNKTAQKLLVAHLLPDKFIVDLIFGGIVHHEKTANGHN